MTDRMSAGGLVHFCSTRKSSTPQDHRIATNLFCLIEIDIGLIVGCMLILPVLFHNEKGFKFVGKYLSSPRSHVLRLGSTLRTKQRSLDEQSQANQLTSLGGVWTYIERSQGGCI